MSTYNVIKIGGNVVDNPEALERFIADFAAMPGQKILVHGGGKEATRLSKALDIPTKMIEGRRITDASTLDVVTMVYAGLINKRIVSRLQSAGCNALGLSGADAHVVTSRKRSPFPIDYGYVGDIVKVDQIFLDSLLDQDIVPVICAITCDADGQLLNSNADGVASAVAVGMSKLGTTDLTYCFEKPGVLADMDNDQSLIRHINPDTYAALKEEGVINAGMIPKIDNALNALNQGVSSVIIKSADNLMRNIATTIRLK
ncbi:MAG: acetylglutamate kinase [Bacteroidales bacterium]|nr:acetylglutamate kinase [Bacteroidales bacterium]